MGAPGGANAACEAFAAWHRKTDIGALMLQQYGGGGHSAAGTHNALLEAKGRYAEMWAPQQADREVSPE